jgi:hypothetical protein
VKPSISIDERGVLLHMTDAEGKGIAVALNTETLTEIVAQGTVALERLKSPETRGQALWSLGRAVVRELFKPNQERADGPSEPDAAREKDRK